MIQSDEWWVAAGRKARRPVVPVMRHGLAWLAVLGSAFATVGATDVEGVKAAAKQRLTPLAVAEAAQVGRIAGILFREGRPAAERLPESFATPPAVVFVAGRGQGTRLASAWAEGDSGTEALSNALAGVRRQLTPEKLGRVDTLEIDLAYGFAPASEGDGELSNVYRGLRGIELATPDEVYRLAPTEMIAMNLSFTRALDRLAERVPVARSDVGTPGARIQRFEAEQLLVEIQGDNPRVTVMYRGNELVPVEAVTRFKVEELSTALSGWLWTNLEPDGRLPYLYWPSRGEESSANNEIRQWMATVVLIREAKSHGEPALIERAEQNIRFNLRRSYREDETGHGLIVEEGGAVKLGAVALACLALTEHPHRERFTREEGALRRTVEALWLPNGEFRTFWQPTHRTDNVNFYPGEALLLWATQYAESRDAGLLDRIMTSLRYYRAWHRENRNPAFVPWHTQAYVKVWQVTRSEEIRDWVFEMNDWLLGVQQWESQRDFPDTMGRFYAPDRPFGPPHVSSTGVYLEGLAEAWKLARDRGDAARQEAYRRALVRGLRSVLQLTFMDEVDMFYISKRDRVRGGVRTTVYDNAIRVDNVQHNLMAIQKVLGLLNAADYRP